MIRGSPALTLRRVRFSGAKSEPVMNARRPRNIFEAKCDQGVT